MRVSKLFKNSGFTLGFSIGICLFAFLNYLSYIISYSKFTNPGKIRFSGGSYTAGFPFPFYQAIIGLPNSFYFDWIGLIVDILIAVAFSFILGLIFKFVWSKISSRRVILK